MIADLQLKRRSSARVAIRLALGAVFLAAGLMKIAHPTAFLSDLLSYEVPFPMAFLRLTAAVLPWLEVICGLFLLSDLWPETVRPLVAALCVVFVAMLFQAVVRGLSLNCGCFGPAGWVWLERPGAALVRAAILLVLSGYLLLPDSPRHGRET